AGGGGGAADLSCTEIFQCLGNCADQACAQACLADGSPAAQGQFNAVQQCIVQNNCAGPDGSVDQACAEAACGNEINACFGGGGGGGPMGNLSCSEFLQCLNTCPPNDQACQQGCVEDTSAEGFNAYNAVVECAQVNNCFGADGSADTACLEANCGGEVEACFGEQVEPMGTDNCGEFVQCLGNCQDQACQQRCVSNVSAQGFDDYNAIIECGQTNMCFDAQGRADQACLEGSCGGQLEACFGAQPEPMGDATCQETLQCILGCQDEACANTCVEGSSPAGFEQFVPLYNCIFENMCQVPDCAACIEQFDACL
ncbi:MAG: hypothetical protein KC613_15940, partial [Myxococcales bacterium]|nr:hypothetical protein [Myxococcales bacterium]